MHDKELHEVNGDMYHEVATVATVLVLSEKESQRQKSQCTADQVQDLLELCVDIGKTAHEHFILNVETLKVWNRRGYPFGSIALRDSSLQQ